MSQRMKSNTVFLRFLYQASKNQRVAIFPHLTKEQVNVLSEVALNIFKGVFPNKQKYLKTLKPYKSVLYQLGSKSLGVRKKKQLLIRYNNLIPHLLGPLLDFL